ncbi:MAG: GatB/YqeY domain-containing protein [Betaproteobacteria bacterium]|nr:GatB/YqeY domain-containing protein [Betaproteobacteria bacterium]
MPLKERINDDMKAAMRAREAARLSAIRLLLAAIKQREVDERVQLDDAGVVAVIDKMQKQRRDSIAQYQAAKRQDLADAEKFELDVLAAYMPQAASEEEIRNAVAAAVAETGAATAQDMGRVMTLLKTRLAGRADMAEVSALVRKALTPAG